jgi:hypothetical protein
MESTTALCPGSCPISGRTVLPAYNDNPSSVARKFIAFLIEIQWNTQKR